MAARCPHTAMVPAVSRKKSMLDRKRVGEGKRVDLGGGRIIKKKKKMELKVCGRVKERHRHLRCNCALESPRRPDTADLGDRLAFRSVVLPALRAAYSSIHVRD